MLARWRRNTRTLRDTLSLNKALILESKLPRYSGITAEIVSDHLKLIMNCFPVSEAPRVRPKYYKLKQIKSNPKINPK